MYRYQKTFMSKKDIKKQRWYLFDAKGKTLGRFASEIAKVLRGKHKTDFTPHADTGDGVIIINAEKIVITGNKQNTKLYRHHTGYPGGLKEVSYSVMKDRKPQYIIFHAVKGMVPKTKQGRVQMKRLRVFVGEDHNMQAQSPVEVGA